MTEIQTTRRIEEGSIVLLRGVEMPEEMSEDFLPQVAEAIEAAAGHRKFALIWTSDGGDGGVEVWGPDVDLRQRINDLLAQRP